MLKLMSLRYVQCQVQDVSWDCLKFVLLVAQGKEIRTRAATQVEVVESSSISLSK